VEIAPVDVAFDAKHHVVHLIIITERAAHQPAGRVERARGKRRGVIRTSPAAAAVDADIEAGPVIRVRPETSRLITEFSEHEADGGEAQERERLAV
jgi:hypothetical protein